mgnify:CR=1 FL=1
MLTKIDLCSMSLLKLGAKPIQSLTDDCAASQLARTLFDMVINSLLTSHPWRFATQEIALNKIAYVDGKKVAEGELTFMIG